MDTGIAKKEQIRRTLSDIGGLENLALSRWEEPRERLKSDTASLSSPGQKVGATEGLECT